MEFWETGAGFRRVTVTSWEHTPGEPICSFCTSVSPLLPQACDESSL